jgi:(p)ppGpp synthase/HD superfamily hydrolase
MNSGHVSKDELISFIENNTKIRIDSFVESAFETAEEVHSDIKREDGTSSFLETHVWPVTLDVIKHYLTTTQYLTTLQITSAILHDVMEDNDRILNLYTSHAYGFDAYFRHRFGEYVYTVADTLKTKPLENYSGSNEEEQKISRFSDYCSFLANSKYDTKIIKLADRLNNMKFIAQIPKHEKIKRYLREAEDFYIAFSLFPPQSIDFYKEIRKAYDDLKRIKITA